MFGGIGGLLGVSGGAGGLSVAPSGATKSGDVNFGDFDSGVSFNSGGNLGTDPKIIIAGLVVAGLVAIAYIKRK